MVKRERCPKCSKAVVKRMHDSSWLVFGCKTCKLLLARKNMKPIEIIGTITVK